MGYVINGKYGYFLTCQNKCKIPEWSLPEEVSLDTPKHLIAYKQNIRRVARKEK
jgi:hypothetical protein